MTKREHLEEALGVAFKKPALLKEALTHRSYLNENPSWGSSQNERLEFLGDAVLELAITEFLFGRFPDDDEGRLTGIRAALVNYQMLASIAETIRLGDFLYLSKGEMKDNGRAREVILANALEAVIGAVYLDRGYGTAQRVVHALVAIRLEEVMTKKLYKDPKSSLQEILQERKKMTPTYRVLSESGPDHAKEFVVGVFVGKEKLSEGKGASKQEAEACAAERGLEEFNESRTF
ncbi:MAG: ribonuclease III [Candidatus Jorgensenbacteria bacterium]|nr:ribonuclease III [Candidatus Jorgensenbacteria bacterium]